MAERDAERGTKADAAKGDINRNEGKQKKPEPVLKTGTQNEDRRGTETNVEVGKTSEDKTMEVLKRVYEAKSNGCRGWNQT